MKVNRLVDRIQRSAERLTRARHLSQDSHDPSEQAAGRRFIARESTLLAMRALRLRVLLWWEGLRRWKGGRP